MRPEGLRQRKKSNDDIGNRTRALPACSAVPQPTAPPRAHEVTSYQCIISAFGGLDTSYAESRFVTHYSGYLLDNRKAGGGKTIFGNLPV